MLLHSATITTLSGLALKLITKDMQRCKIHGTATKRKHQYAILKTEDFIAVKSRGESLVFANYSHRGWTSL